MAHLDPVLLAALALEAPVLLVGEHGTAKTLLVERLAAALGLEFRHYNASLLNYDDLVGIPLPDDARRAAVRRHARVRSGMPSSCSSTRSTAAGRTCRTSSSRSCTSDGSPGVALPKLRHRWAAMNPPAPDDDSLGGYLGAEPLDAALADRFWFVVRVPGLGPSCARDDREALAAGTAGRRRRRRGSPASSTQVAAGSTTEASDAVRPGRPYAVTVAELLRQGGRPLSPRRSRMLVRSIAAVHAAAARAGSAARR